MNKKSNQEMTDLAEGSMMVLYKRLATYLTPYKWRFAFGILFGALYGVVNGVMVLVINSVTNVVFGSSKSFDDFEKIQSKVPVADYEQAKESFKIVEEVIQKNSESVSVFNTEILLVALLIPTIMVARGLCGYLNAYYMLWCSLRILSDIRIKLYRRLMGQSLDYFNQRKGGEIMQTVFNQTRLAQETLTTASSDIVKQPIAIVLSLIHI